MRFTPNTVYHIYNRGNNKQRIFFSEANYLFFLRKLQNHIAQHCEILCWCLMPNHFHFMVYATSKSCEEDYGSIKLKIQSLTYWIGIIQSSYAQTINKQNGTTGSLFQSKPKAKELPESDHIIRCLHYIHQNPFKAQMVQKPGDWRFSSFLDYAGQRFGTLCNQSRLFDLTGYDKEAFLIDSASDVSDTDLFYY